MLIPAMPGGKYSNKNYNTYCRQQQYNKTRTIGPELHIGPPVPARQKIGKSGHYQYNSQGQPPDHMPPGSALTHPVMLPVFHKTGFLFGQFHNAKIKHKALRYLQLPDELIILCQLIAKAVKLASLLTQYLYAHHRLDLPGIGSFILDPAIASQLATARPNQLLTDGIQFEYNPNLPESSELIAYISAQTGKMKALASSDLESHIQLAHQFLNIGKPFHFEGIGTLTRLKPGEFEFVADALQAPDRKRDSQSRESSKTQPKEEQSPRYESFLTEKKASEGWRKPVIALLILIGLGLAVWGGYAISKKSRSAKEITTETPPGENIQPPAIDTTRHQLPDSIPPAPVTTPRTSDTYKYVLEVSNQTRALKRYNQLRTNLWDVKLETKDSVSYKLFVLLPGADTTRIADSLTVFLGRKVYIEK